MAGKLTGMKKKLINSDGMSLTPQMIF